MLNVPYIDFLCFYFELDFSLNPLLLHLEIFQLLLLAEHCRISIVGVVYRYRDVVLCIFTPLLVAKHEDVELGKVIAGILNSDRWKQELDYIGVEFRDRSRVMKVSVGALGKRAASCLTLIRVSSAVAVLHAAVVIRNLANFPICGRRSF